jgi:hypothetical protein
LVDGFRKNSAGNDVRSARRKMTGIKRHRFSRFRDSKTKEEEEGSFVGYRDRVIDGWDIPFEFVGKISSSSAVAKTGDIEGRSAARHLEKGVDE